MDYILVIKLKLDQTPLGFGQAVFSFSTCPKKRCFGLLKYVNKHLNMYMLLYTEGNLMES